RTAQTRSTASASSLPYSFDHYGWGNTGGPPLPGVRTITLASAFARSTPGFDLLELKPERFCRDGFDLQDRRREHVAMGHEIAQSRGAQVVRDDAEHVHDLVDGRVAQKTRAVRQRALRRIGQAAESEGEPDAFGDRVQAACDFV